MGFARLSPGRARRTAGIPAPGVPAGPDRSGLVRARCPSRSGDRRGRVRRRRRTWRRRGRRRCAAGTWSSPSVASRRRVCGRRRARRRGGGGVAPCAGSGPCGRGGGRDVARAPLTGSTPSGPVLAAHACLLSGRWGRAGRSGPVLAAHVVLLSSRWGWAGGRSGPVLAAHGCSSRGVGLGGAWGSGPVLAAHACLLSGRWGRAGRSGPVLAAHVVLLSGAGDGLVGQVQFLPRTGGPLSASEAG
ncbi:MAG: hypothetical protein QOG20_1207 [Pseudonocardiales bacterium]|nr:hypothetical protein [Pseudonocardiales bacterium]